MTGTTTALCTVFGLAILVGTAALTGTAGAAGEAEAAVPDGSQDAALSEERMAQGQELFQKNCRFCHGTKGTSGKRLAGNERVADAEYVANVILTGPGYMTPFAEHLNDEEIALIVTYVRNSWGNSYGPMQGDDVAALR